MTLDQLQTRDARIAELEAIPRRQRRPEEQDDLGRLHLAREAYWRRLPDALAATRRRAAMLEFYARQIGLPLISPTPALNDRDMAS